MLADSGGATYVVEFIAERTLHDVTHCLGIFGELIQHYKKNVTQTLKFLKLQVHRLLILHYTESQYGRLVGGRRMHCEISVPYGVELVTPQRIHLGSQVFRQR